MNEIQVVHERWTNEIKKKPNAPIYTIIIYWKVFDLNKKNFLKFISS